MAKFDLGEYNIASKEDEGNHLSITFNAYGTVPSMTLNTNNHRNKLYLRKVD